ncbi:MAG: hypothetical protein AVDCRST_MAG50-2947, partial [uncultured Acidimicrobiales bacterium]
ETRVLPSSAGASGADQGCGGCLQVGEPQRHQHRRRGHRRLGHRCRPGRRPLPVSGERARSGSGAAGRTSRRHCQSQEPEAYEHRRVRHRRARQEVSGARPEGGSL